MENNRCPLIVEREDYEDLSRRAVSGEGPKPLDPVRVQTLFLDTSNTGSLNHKRVRIQEGPTPIQAQPMPPS